MATKLATEEWIKRARAIWGNKYDYSKVKYVNAKTPVIVKCPIANHGKWKCNPDNHIAKKRGCPKCRGGVRKSFDQFVSEARKVHETTYTYPNQIYANAFTPLTIVCKAHGEFKQSPDAHIRGQGCPACGIKRVTEKQKLSEKEINKRLAELSAGPGGRCRVAKGTYSAINKQAQIVCSIHGKQPQRLMNSTLHGRHPCLECSGNKYSQGRSTEQFKDLIKSKFGRTYKIKPFQYLGKRTRVTLICNKAGHGEFSLNAGSIYRSPGCPVCARTESNLNRIKGLLKKNESTKNRRAEMWLEKARAKHGGYYDYSKVKYKGARGPVNIVCPVHGVFSQPPATHIVSGCRLCANDNLYGLYNEQYFRLNPESKKRPALLYYVKFRYKQTVFYKVGITTNDIRSRFAMVPKDKVSITKLGFAELPLLEAWQAEETLQRKYGDSSRYKPKLGNLSNRKMRIGPSECFSQPLPESVVRKVFR